MGSEGTRSLGLVFTHELHPDTGDEGGNIDPGVTHAYTYTHTRERTSARCERSFGGENVLYKGG